MKSIIVATDFSASAEQATDYAARLCQRLQASLVLVHTYQMPVTMSDMPVMMVSAEELKNSAEKSLMQSKDAILQMFPDLAVQVEARMGDLVDEINSLCDEMTPVAVVIGSKGYTGLERLLFGNTSMSVVRHCRFPVITLSAEGPARLPQKAALATDLKNIDSMPADRVMNILQALGARLHIIHVAAGDEKVPDATKASLEMMFQPIHEGFTTIKDEEVVDGVNRFIYQHGIDMLIVMPQEHNLFEKVFFRLHTEGLIESTQIPVMAIHPQ